MTLEMGKPVAESKAEFVYAADFFRWFSGEALRIDGNYKQLADGTSRVLVMKQPVAPSLMITPWNFPMAMGARKVGPAIAAGCTIVMKPAQQTPLSMLALGQILEEAGLPGGVFNIVTTYSSSKTTGPLIQDPRLRKQAALKYRGLYPIAVDGVKGPFTAVGFGAFSAQAPAGRRDRRPQTKRALGRRRLRSRMLQRGNRGWDVAALQFRLQKHGFPPGGVDGVFGPGTRRAVMSFQSANGLGAEGIAGRLRSGRCGAARCRAPPPSRSATCASTDP